MDKVEDSADSLSDKASQEYLLKAHANVLENENLSPDLYKKLEKQHNIIQADVRRMKIMHETMANN